MTERLYYTDSYLRDFEAEVVKLSDDGRKGYLDRTGFYPTPAASPAMAAFWGAFRSPT